MMVTQNIDEVIQDAEWSTLYGLLCRHLAQFGAEDAFGNGDFWVLSDNYGWLQQKVCLHNLNLLTVPIIISVQKLLRNYPKWTVVFTLDEEGKENEPPMGVTIRKHEIIDGLLRNYLPERFRFLKIPGSRIGTGYD